MTALQSHQRFASTLVDPHRKPDRFRHRGPEEPRLPLHPKRSTPHVKAPGRRQRPPLYTDYEGRLTLPRLPLQSHQGARLDSGFQTIQQHETKVPGAKHKIRRPQRLVRPRRPDHPHGAAWGAGLDQRARIEITLEVDNRGPLSLRTKTRDGGYDQRCAPRTPRPDQLRHTTSRKPTRREQPIQCLDSSRNRLPKPDGWRRSGSCRTLPEVQKALFFGCS